MEETDTAALEPSGTATTENSSSGTSKRSREDEDDDSGPSSKILKSSDDSDPPSEEEQQAIEAAKTAIENTKKLSGSEEEMEPTEEVVPAVPAASETSIVLDTDTTPTEEKDAQADTPQPAEPTETSLDSSDNMNTETSNEEAQKDGPAENSPAPPQEVNVEPAAEGEPQGTSEKNDPAPEASTEQMNVEPSVADEPKDEPQEQAAQTPSEPVPTDPQVPTTAPVDPQAPMAAPAPGPTPPVVQEQAPPPQQQPAQSAPQPDYVEESGQIAALYVGRVIGKGGEMIRDLQARSGAKMDVDSNVPPGQPRTITYAGTRAQVEFAKQLVNMLHQNVPEESLPLGHACQEMVIIPATGVGKVIGRGGEMIRELQSRSQAKIQVDHTGTSGLPAHEKQVSVTGTAEAVAKAREMVLFLVNNPLMEAQQSLNMLVEEKRSGASAWGSGPPYPSMPNQGMNMQPPAAPMDPYGGAAQYGGQGGYSQTPYGSQQQMQQPQQPQQPRGDGAETMLASKQFMGRIIGSKGVTINDLQQRSGTHIQINQEVAGAESEITITGPPAGIRAAKGMIQEILASGPNHPYAGGGGGSGGGGPYGANPAGGGMPGYPGGAGGGGGYHGAGYGGGGGYPSQGAMTSYGGGYPPQQQQHQQQSHQPPPQYGGYDTQAMAYGGYGGDPYGGGGGGGAPGGYGGGGGGAPGGYGAAAAAQYPGGAYGASGYGGQAAASYGAYGGAGGGAYGAPSGYSMPAPAPPAASAGPWKMATSPDGQVYYYNEQTGQTQWEKPPGM